MLISVFALLACASARLGAGLKLPPMGFNTWNRFKCDFNEDIIKTAADIMIDEGLAASGYVYVNLGIVKSNQDDCWSLKERDPLTNRIVADPIKFPSGMKSLADYLHGRGLKLGIYADAGPWTCQG